MPDKNILLVEDEDNIALALEFLIKGMGYQARRVADGQAAVDALNDVPPDVVVLDVMLPKRSGYEVCQIIRDEPALKDTKILMMTASGGEIERRKGMALGADAFLTKPFANAELREKIRSLLQDDTENGPSA